MPEFVKAGFRSAEDLFTIQGLRSHPALFFKALKKLVEARVRPTLTHAFLKLLHDKDLLLRVYTQNVDGLELAANVPADKVIQAHGSLDKCLCSNERCQGASPAVDCNWGEMLERDPVPRCELCSSPLRPNIVLYGNCR
jgi:NAD-dependent SIR2 family protein deacetylase